MFSAFLRVACAALFYVCAAAAAFAGFTVSAIAGLALFVLVAVTPASAASIDFSPLIEMGFSFANELAVGLAFAVLGYIAVLVKRKTGIDLAIMQQGDNRMFHEGIQRGVDTIESVIREKVVKDRSFTITVNSPIITAQANRMLKASPDLLKRMGISKETLRQRILERIEATINRAT